MTLKILICGDFGIIHEGHLDHIIKAYQLGDYLTIVTHSDESIKERKNYKPISLWARVMILRGIINLLGGEGRVVLAKDTDGKCVKTLRHYKPDIFAKGGDRTPDTMPEEELKVCEELGIKIIYGIGDLLNSSREINETTKEL